MNSCSAAWLEEAVTRDLLVKVPGRVLLARALLEPERLDPLCLGCVALALHEHLHDAAPQLAGS